MADMRPHRFSNNAACRLGEDLSVGETSLQLESGKGSLFPALTAGQVFTLTIENLQTGAREIVYATARAGDVVTIERGKEGTDDQEWINSTSVIVQHRVTADTLDYLASGGDAAELDFNVSNPDSNDMLVFDGYEWVNRAQPCEFQLACSNLTADITAGTNKAYFRAPFRFRITEIRASLLVAAESGTFTVDVNVNGASILSTKLTLDATEKTSETAATAAVITNPYINDDNEVTIDVDDAAAGARGLIVTFIGERT